jgi:hypothetical protein
MVSGVIEPCLTSFVLFCAYHNLSINFSKRKRKTKKKAISLCGEDKTVKVFGKNTTLFL